MISGVFRHHPAIKCQVRLTAGVENYLATAYSRQTEGRTDERTDDRRPARRWHNMYLLHAYRRWMYAGQAVSW